MNLPWVRGYHQFLWTVSKVGTVVIWHNRERGCGSKWWHVSDTAHITFPSPLESPGMMFGTPPLCMWGCLCSSVGTCWLPCNGSLTHGILSCQYSPFPFRQKPKQQQISIFQREDVFNSISHVLCEMQARGRLLCPSAAVLPTRGETPPSPSAKGHSTHAKMVREKWKSDFPRSGRHHRREPLLQMHAWWTHTPASNSRQPLPKHSYNFWAQVLGPTGYTRLHSHWILLLQVPRGAFLFTVFVARVPLGMSCFSLPLSWILLWSIHPYVHSCLCHVEEAFLRPYSFPVGPSWLFPSNGDKDGLLFLYLWCRHLEGSEMEWRGNDFKIGEASAKESWAQKCMGIIPFGKLLS